MNHQGEARGARAGPPGGALDHAQRRFLRAGRVLVAGGCLVVTDATISNSSANGEHAFAGFLLLLLGFFLIALPPVANRFPGAARFGGAVADAVLLLLLLFPPVAARSRN